MQPASRDRYVDLPPPRPVWGRSVHPFFPSPMRPSRSSRSPIHALRQCGAGAGRPRQRTRSRSPLCSGVSCRTNVSSPTGQPAHILASRRSVITPGWAHWGQRGAPMSQATTTIVDSRWPL